MSHSLDRVRVDGQNKLVAVPLAAEVEVKMLAHVGLDLLKGPRRSYGQQRHSLMKMRAFVKLNSPPGGCVGPHNH